MKTNEPNSRCQRCLRKVIPCIAKAPYSSVAFLPLSSIGGYSAEEMYYLSKTCLKGILRRVLCMRGAVDSSLVAVKILARFGVWRVFPEPLSVSRLVFLEPNEAQSTFNDKVIAELRAWLAIIPKIMGQQNLTGNHIQRAELVPAEAGVGWKPFTFDGGGEQEAGDKLVLDATRVFEDSDDDAGLVD